jgi:flagellar biogenesis protein FliO
MEATQQALSILVVLALLGGTLWWLRTRGMATFVIKTGAGKVKAMKLVERLPLTPQHSLYLVKVEDRTLLIAASPGGCSILETQERVSAR